MTQQNKHGAKLATFALLMTWTGLQV